MKAIGPEKGERPPMSDADIVMSEEIGMRQRRAIAAARRQAARNAKAQAAEQARKAQLARARRRQRARAALEADGYQRRNAAIIERAARGVPIKAVADEFGLTHQRISQILGKTGEKRGSNTEVDWTSDLIKRLRRDWKTGRSTAEIGRRLGVSKNAVIGKADRLGLPARPSPIRPKGSGKYPHSERKPRRVVSCCWPIGELLTPGFRLCDAPSVPGTPYCEAHRTRNENA